MGSDGTYAHCSREEHAGGLPQERLETYAHRLEGPCKCGETHGDAPIVQRDVKPGNGSNGSNGNGNGHHYKPVGQWEYEGGLIVIRAEDELGEKRYWQRHRLPDGRIEQGVGQAPRTLYRANEVREAPAAQWIWLVEGEKCADALAARGMVATTTPQGAASWQLAAPRAAAILKGRQVVILPDHDENGAKYAQLARATLESVVSGLRILDLPGLADAEDVYDWLARGHDVEELVKLAEERPDLVALSSPPTSAPPAPVRIVRVVDEIIAEAALPVISTGFLGLDTQLGGGLRARMLHVIVAGSGKGKTSLSVQIAARHAEHSPVLYYSGELTRAQLAARLIGQRTNHSWREVLRGQVDRAAMVNVLQPLEFDILRGCPEPVTMITLAADEMLSRGHGVPLIVVDYAQIVADVGNDPRLNLMMAIRQLTALVESRDIVLLLLSQGSRPSARAMRNGGGNTEDYVDAGAETSDIEKAASTVIALVYASADGVATHEVTAMIAKQRLGGPCKVGLKFHGPSGRWEDLGHAPESPAAKKKAERVALIIGLVERHRAHFTKTELRNAAGGDTTATIRLIDELVAREALVYVNVVRRNTTGISKARPCIDLPPSEVQT